MTNVSISQQLFSLNKTLEIDFEALSDSTIKILEAKPFLAREKAKTFDFNMHAAHEPIILSNKIVMEVYARGLFGLAAPQIGIDYKAIVVNGIDAAMFNPTITARSGEPVAMEEISPTFPLSKVVVKREPIIEVKYLDPHGKFVRRAFTGMTARVVQQLVEVLEGGSLLDHVSTFRRKKILEKKKK